jgi:hypothetical protein
MLKDLTRPMLSTIELVGDRRMICRRRLIGSCQHSTLPAEVAARFGRPPAARALVCCQILRGAEHVYGSGRF